jgi:hypothetical protein
MLRLKALVVSLLVLCSGCATVTGSTAHVERAGYICTVGRSFVGGVWAGATLDDKGNQVRANWGLRNRGFAAPVELIVTSEVTGDSALRTDAGLAVISTRAPQWGRRNKRHRLELTADQNPRFLQHGVFAGGFTRIEELRLHTNWADLLAFSRGASRLILIVRNEEGAISDSVELSPSLITSAENEVGPVLSRLSALTKDYRDRCEYVEDIDPVIIVT